MFRRWTFLLIVLLYVDLSRQISTPDSDSYVAAVVEFSPVLRENNGPLTLRENTDRYLEYIREASEGGADIVVFPEDGLTSISMPDRSTLEPWTTLVPSADDNYTPCTENSVPVSDTLKKISCAAQRNKIYVVINIAEKFVSCKDRTCSSDEPLYHNTNVAFDRTGKIIARYRKVNLFNTETLQYNATRNPEVVFFDTDFGVRFGTFICFDILFYVPALNLTRDLGITDIAYSTAWFSEVPFLTAVQTQFGWAFSEDVNLLSAGYNNPSKGSTGSGIYLGRRAAGKAIFSHSVRDQLLIFQVPKIRKSKDVNHQTETTSLTGFTANIESSIKSPEEQSDLLYLLRDNMSAFKTAAINSSDLLQLCHNELCCSFTGHVSNDDSTSKYRLFAFDGIRFYGKHQRAAVQACGVVQCSNDSVSSCGSIMKSSTSLSIELSATFHDYKNILIMPSVTNSSLLPIPGWTYEEHKHDDHVHVTMTLESPTRNIATFGLYARIFPKDPKNSASSTTGSFVITFFALKLLCLLNSSFK